MADKRPPSRPARAGALAAGAARASGERARRTSTPLIGLAPVEAAPDAKTTQAAESTAPAPNHRPSPTVSSRPTAKARAQSGARAEAPPPRVPRMSPRRKRELDEAAARRLRVVPPAKVAAADAAADDPATAYGSADQPPVDPTIHPTSDGVHLPSVEDAVATLLTLARSLLENSGLSTVDLEAHADRIVAYLKRRLAGDYELDEFGFDQDFTENVIFPLLRPLANSWFRVEVRGIENIPVDGPALVVANHSGTVAVDSLITQVVVHDHHPKHRFLRMLGADLVFQTPFLGTLSRRGGSTLATNADAARLFEQGELVAVWPEGFKGVGKPFSERYKLQRFGRGGFVQSALAAQVPIIPCSIVGAEEIAPMIGNMKVLARLLGLPYAPITPTFPWLGPLGLIPLPSKWIIEFGEPIHTESYGAAAAEDPMLVFELTDQVRERIQQTLYELLARRRSVFF